MQGRCIFASGSPFDPVTISDQVYRPGQCNNSYVFPGIGLAVVLSQAWKIPEELFLKAARVRYVVSLFISAVTLIYTECTVFVLRICRDCIAVILLLVKLRRPSFLCRNHVSQLMLQQKHVFQRCVLHVNAVLKIETTESFHFLRLTNFRNPLQI